MSHKIVMKNMKYTRIKNKGIRVAGFTLFVSLLVTSLLLAVSFSLSDIVLKQLVFSQSARESQISFYAADSGAECALFWDRKDAFGTTTPYGAFATSTQLGTSDYDLYCGYGVSGDGKVGVFQKDVNNFAATTTFYINFQDAVSPSSVSGQKVACAKVTVSKYIDFSSSTNPIERTIIDSRGYDAPFSGQVGIIGPSSWGQGQCEINSNRIIERAIRINY